MNFNTKSETGDNMRTGERTGLWLLAAALLASLDFSYAHLQQLALWPLQLIASSLWRLMTANGVTNGGSSVWLAPAAIILAGLIAELGALWARRRAAFRTHSEGDDHE